MERTRKSRKTGAGYVACLALTVFFALWLTGCAPAQERSEMAAGYAMPGMKVHFLDVGQADSTLIQTEDGAMLIDAGNREDRDTILDYLDSQGIKRLDYVIGTHPHEDHIGSMSAVIERYEVGTLILPDKLHTTRTYESMLLSAEEKGLFVTLAQAGREYKLGENARFTILAPNGDYGDKLNNWSVGVKVTYGQDRFLFCGDAEEEAEKDMLSSGQDLEAEVFKVSHHGSDTSNSEEFLDAVSPGAAVISCGEENSYGHPHQSVLDSLKSRNVQIYRTDEQGTVVASASGNGIVFESESAASGQITIHRTETGGKYHRAKCPSLKNSDIELTLDEAKAAGLEPCGRCEPPE